MVALGLIVLMTMVALTQVWGRLTKLEARIEQLELGGFSFRSGDEAISEPAAAPVEIPTQPVPQAVPGAGPIVAAAEASVEPVVPQLRNEEAGPQAEPDRGFSFEDIFGRRLPIWGGGITLAVAGMLIVKYSIDAGLVSPLVRVMSGLIFGLGLISAAEIALRAEDRVRDPRVRQALAGAGIASLYGAILIAANLYGLINPVTAFVGMAAVTALAMALSLRFGAPSALLGLAGGLAAPALVGSGEPNIPLLSAYLALAVGGLSVLSRSQRWMWLGVAALAGGFGWAGLLLVGGTLDAAGSISIGLYIILLGVGIPMVAFSGRLGNSVRVAGSIAAAAQMAGLVAVGGFTLLHWGLFGLISAAILWLSGRDERLARLPAVGLALMLLLLAAWPEPSAGDLGMVMALGAALYGIMAIIRLWRPGGNMVEAAQVAALALAGLIVPMIHFYGAGSNDAALALAGLGAALIPAGAAALGWRSEERNDDARFALLVTSAALLVAASAILGLPSWTFAPVVGLLGLALLALSLWARDSRIERSGWSFAASSMVLLSVGFQAGVEVGRLLGLPGTVEVAVALIRWMGVSIILALFGWRGRSVTGCGIAKAGAALLAYGAAAQVLTPDVLPLTTALGLVALAQWCTRLAPGALLPAMGALMVVTMLWAADPLLLWAGAASKSLVGVPLLVTQLPSVRDTIFYLLAPAVLVGLATLLASDHLRGKARITGAVLAGVAGGVALHILFKQLWSIGSGAEFVRFGFAERTGWEALFIAAALLAWGVDQRRAALGLSAAGLAHFTFYTMILHNPLLAEQAVGGLPIINLLLPAYGIPLALLWVLGRREPGSPALVERVRAAAPMLLIVLFAFSSLRQMFHGSILLETGVTAGEDICRSILAVLLAVGFLLWGIRSGSRDWRIASLVLMIAAVAKVFLFDASGLDGLLRIGSFVALGLSLIGIGWLYSRYLGESRPLTPQR
jgi:uncharacterized membrane protein